jgi:cysteine desulfurase
MRKRSTIHLKIMSKPMRIYLDYAASTPADKEVVKAMEPYFGEKYGNPGSLHSFGQEALAAIDSARETIARSIGADFHNIVFTSSATEANNLALWGTILSARRSVKGLSKIIISGIEHDSVLKTAREMEHAGEIELTILPVGRNGTVDTKTLVSALDARTVLVSVIYASNEIGTIEPIRSIAEAISDFRGGKQYPLFHTDAAQAFQFLDCDVNRLGVDLMTVSAHKIYGPKGIGMLYVRKSELLSPIVIGGGQEFGLRSGTENVPAIVGFGKAVELAVAERGKGTERLRGLRNLFWSGIKGMCPGADENGGGEKLPNILNVYFPHRAAPDLLVKFDLAGIAVSSGSACSARSSKPSHVLRALGYDDERATESVRFSFGKPTTQNELSEALKRMEKIFR